ncbi:hypothetical protein M758_9G000200 [Ceratodon purpureus]|uniref:Secreted protein n=1 Tax=Ceratodon purpureus TaxID=3225 RepID=A0A8T0GSG6_CERPU|nr:hypothetical protein KC19_9G000200 [Ceratodon purpureus]KAG0604686.1 hypothetical protein M758_9G000200 [Ceratodon purpureus]
MLSFIGSVLLLTVSRYVTANVPYALHVIECVLFAFEMVSDPAQSIEDFPMSSFTPLCICDGSFIYCNKRDAAEMCLGLR